MMRRADTDLTLPSIIAVLGGAPARLDLVLTIIFHADTARIGHKAVVPLQTGDVPWVLGRCSPEFNGTCDTPPQGSMTRMSVAEHYNLATRVSALRFVDLIQPVAVASARPSCTAALNCAGTRCSRASL